MKTSRLLGFCTASLLLPVAAQIALALQTPQLLSMAAQAVTQQRPDDESDRRTAGNLLARARAEIENGNYPAAEELIGRVESMDVKFGLWHVGDSPKRLRKLLKTRSAAAGQPRRPSQQFQPADPFADKTVEAVEPQLAEHGSNLPRSQSAAESLDPASIPEESLPMLSRRDQRLTGSSDVRAVMAPPTEAPDDSLVSSPRDNEVAAPPTQPVDGARHQSDAFLVGARKALAVGDAKRATQLVEQAKGLNVRYSFLEDSPAKVESQIRKHQDIASAHPQPDSAAARQQRATLLMEEAQQLLLWKEFDEAERLVTDARQLRATFGLFEVSPNRLLANIAAARKEHRAGQASGPQPPDNRMSSGNPFAAAGDQQAPVNIDPPSATRQNVLKLTASARAAIAAGRLDEAEGLVRQAESLQIPDSQFGPKDDRPWMVSLDIQKTRAGIGKPPVNVRPLAASEYPVRRGLYDPAKDSSRNMPASSNQADGGPPDKSSEGFDELTDPTSAERDAGTGGGDSQTAKTPAMRLLVEGEQALQNRDRARARELFTEAYQKRDDLDPASRQRLQDHLQALAVKSAPEAIAAPGATPIDAEAAKQRLMARQLSAEVGKLLTTADNLHEKSPRESMAKIKQARAAVEASAVDAQAREHLLRRVDRALSELTKYIEKNKEQIAQDSRNKEILDDIHRKQITKVEIDERLAKLVDDFNRLVDEERYPEAEVVAKRAKQIAPENPIVLQLQQIVKILHRKHMNMDIGDRKERGFVNAMDSMDESTIPFDDRHPLQFQDAKKWEELTKTRAQRMADSRNQRSQRELDIERKLKTPVSLKFRDRPLSEVLDHLAKLAAVNLHVDPQGLAEEGVSSDTPVTIDLTQDITLKSALHLILEPLHLSYVIKDEVLKITSEQLRDGQVFTATYTVADLVIPIPHFVPNERMGLAGALRNAYETTGAGGGAPGSFNDWTTSVASQNGSPASAVINPAVMAQMQANGAPGSPAAGGQQSIPFGPGGVQGGAQADFDALIDLIVTTIAPTTWDEVGGPGSIKEFETNLSLVISQTQEVHEQIIDLLDQLRRNQDLQVTIEVRFITLNDNFFERIGVDFDFNIDDNIPATLNPRELDDQGPSATVGLQDAAPGQPFPNFTADLDIPFRQESFTLAVPQFGQPVDVARFGFAILSDIEAYFLVAAAQGDRRSNVLQAPKVTLFNGQQAFVSDTSQTPFVISVIPVVGDFAAAQQPVIVVLSEGTFLTVQAVISSDRRFVRLTVVPFFSQIGDVEEFTFSGSRTTTENTSRDEQGDDTSTADDRTVSTEGVTVQLPTFSFVTVTTTVSVPDGGTVLLGGIKRLSEGRNEFGVPILSKLPYINRLFKNVGIGRETQSLMMMVTPRIIIQEEEEARLGVTPPPAP